MRYTIDVQRAAGQGWQTTVQGLAAPAVREIARLEGQSAGFPQTTEGIADPACALSCAADAALPAEVYTRIASGNPRQGEVGLFGRYLFHALLGQALWESIKAHAAGQPIELALSFAAGDWEMHRLPWEMLHSGHNFLAAEPGIPVAVTRLVRRAQAAVDRTVRPRVLFVVGASLSDPELRPGAEYLCLLRRLQSGGLMLKSRLLLEATPSRLKQEMNAFRPSVVHFICHGEFAQGRAAVLLPDDSDQNRPKPVDAQQLADLLLASAAPEMVVLNACYSSKAAPLIVGGNRGGLPMSRQRLPLAMELVERGIPAVVGMGGRVSDRACRLFTRRFYEALLSGDPILAAAEGRRAGHSQGTSPEDTVDWALPAIFLDEKVTLRADCGEAHKLKVFHNAAEQHYLIDRNPPAFCDRIRPLADLYEMLSPPSSQHRVRRVMAIYDQTDPSQRIGQFGRTRLVEQLADQAARAGHIPCLVKFITGDEPAKDFTTLADRIRRAIVEARDHFGLPKAASYEVRKLRFVQTGRALPEPLHNDLAEVLKDEDPDDLAAVRTALSLDLLRLAADARTQLQEPDLLAIVLIDDLQRFPFARQFVDTRFLKSEGLGTKEQPVPVVFSFAKPPDLLGGYEPLFEFVNNKGSWYVQHVLEAFPADDTLAYQQFLLQYDKPLVLHSRSENDTGPADFLEEMHSIVRGIPSFLKLKHDDLAPLIRFAFKQKVLEEADDDAWLKAQAGGGK